MNLINPIIISTFTTVFLAELGDKTQLATLAMSAGSKKPLAVLIGSSSALVLACFIGVLLGGTVSNIIPDYLLKALSAIGFVILGSSLLKPFKKI